VCNAQAGDFMMAVPAPAYAQLACNGTKLSKPVQATTLLKAMVRVPTVQALVQAFMEQVPPAMQQLDILLAMVQPDTPQVAMERMVMVQAMLQEDIKLSLL
jgi:hypothetical protein